MINRCKKNIKELKSTIIGSVLIISSLVYAFISKDISLAKFLTPIGITLILSPDKIFNILK